MKVLLADDNKVNQLITEKLLAQIGVITKSVDNGNEVIRNVHHTEFDLILIDLQMPGLDGIQTAKELRKDLSHHQRIPIAAYTTGTRYEIHRKIKGAGFTDVLQKPCDPDELYNLIQKYSKKRIDDDADPNVRRSKDALFKYSDYDLEFAAELIVHFIENYKEFKKIGVSACKERNRVLYTEAWHKIHSSNMIFGINHMDELNDKIKQSLKNTQLPMTNQLIAELEMVCDKIITELRTVKQLVNLK